MTLTTQPLARGTAFSRYLAMRGRNPLNPKAAAPHAARIWPSTPNVARGLEMTAVGAGTSTTDGDLVPFDLAADLIDAIRPATVVDRLAQFMRRVPFNIHVPRVTTGTLGSWIGKGLPIPAAAAALDRVTLPRTAGGAIIVLSPELVQDSDAATIEALRQSVVGGVSEFLDREFLDPDITEIEDVRPASITNGATAISSTGTGSDAIIDNAASMIESLNDAMLTPVWIMSRGTAVHIHVQQVKAGITSTITAAGGLFLGIPVITTGSALFSDSPGESVIALVDAARLLIADSGLARVAISENATLQMDTAPTNSAATGTGAAQVSLMQTDAIAIRVIVEKYWLRAVDSSVVYMRVNY